jgi:hypothetical protein
MDSLPPNDPNENQPGRIKEAPPDGRKPISRRGPTVNANGEREMEIMDLRDQGVVVIMFLIGLASYLLRERCTC